MGKQPLYPHVPGGKSQASYLKEITSIGDIEELVKSSRLLPELARVTESYLVDMKGYYEAGVRHFRAHKYCLMAEMLMKAGVQAAKIELLLQHEVRPGYGDIPDSKLNTAEKITLAVERFMEDAVGNGLGDFPG